jgi:hypothetical protein
MTSTSTFLRRWSRSSSPLDIDLSGKAERVPGEDRFPKQSPNDPRCPGVAHQPTLID